MFNTKLILSLLVGLILLLMACKKEQKIKASKGKLPSIEIIEPNNPQSYYEEETIVLKTVAADQDGRIEKVEFYVDEVLLFSAKESPYFFEWKGKKEVGKQNIKAIAYDNKTNQSEVTLVIEILKDFRTIYLGDFDFEITTVEESNNQQTTKTDNAVGIVSINGGSPNLMLASSENAHQYVTIQFDAENTVLATLETDGKLGEYSANNIELTGGFSDKDHLEFKITQVEENTNGEPKPDYILTRTIKGTRK